LPVIVVNNAWTMPQERYNADWIREQRLGIVLGSFRGVDSAVAQLLDGLDGFRARVGRIQNRALFEIPDILARVLAENTPITFTSRASTSSTRSMSSSVLIAESKSR
jgi:hypothetical protein